MRARVMLWWLVALVVVVSAIAGATAGVGDEYLGVHISGSGPFKVWQGVDGENPSQNTLAIIEMSTGKGFKLTFTPAQGLPSVTIGPGFAEILAPPGYHVHWGGHFPNMILYCTNEPIEGAPPGSIVCWCQMGTSWCDGGGIIPPVKAALDMLYI